MHCKANIFNIQHFSLHDGPGIRTSVFMNGCPLRCYWCHNPESFVPFPQVQFYAAKCTFCGRCAKRCPNAHNGERALFTPSCTLCGECVKTCWSQALISVGREVSLEELYEEIASDRDLYDKSGGGVTFTGGEPLLQPSFLYEILKKCREGGIHTALETSGFSDWSIIRKLLPYLDYIFYDIKVFDKEKHLAGTGVSNERIVHNLEMLCETDSKVTVRVPVIPGFNDSKEDIREIAAWLASQKRMLPVELMPFHGICVGKYEALGLEYPAAGLSEPTKEKLRELAEVFRTYSINIVNPDM